MRNRVFYGAVLAILLTSVAVFTFDIHQVRAESMMSVLIESDGTVHPSEAPVKRIGDVYILTDNIYYLIVESDSIVVDGAGYIVHGVSLYEASNVTIKNMEIFGPDGIDLRNSDNNKICHNTIIDNSTAKRDLTDGILLINSTYNAINENVVRNFDMGIVLDISDGNIIRENLVSNTTRYEGWENFIVVGGIIIERSSSNIIEGNSLLKNRDGVGLMDSFDNIIYHNNFIDNVFQIRDWYFVGYGVPSINTWDNGYLSGGNYWSDCTGQDSDGDGIGDSPYVIDENNQDLYPLMSPWSPRPQSPIPTINELLETVKTCALLVIGAISAIVVLGGIMVLIAFFWYIGTHAPKSARSEVRHNLMLKRQSGHL